MRRLGWILVAAAALAGTAAEGRTRLESGRRFALRACAGCHAVGVTGASANPLSPPFRLLPHRLKGSALPRELRTISAHGHGQMPPIYMTPAERRALVVYVRSVSKRAAHRRG
jgi:mono/diheme cytochrome c family protein